MKQLARLFGVLLIAGCSNAPVTQSPDIPDEEEPRASIKTVEKNHVAARFENAIARKLLDQIADNAHSLKQGHRHLYLKQMANQFRQSVDLDSISPDTIREFQTLEFLLEQESLRQGDYGQQINAQSSLTLTLDEYEALIIEELERIDHVIATLAVNPFDDQFNLEDHMAEVRASATYPEDSEHGRQRYLDQIAETMYQTQVDWPDLLKTYPPFNLAIEGKTDSTSTFTFDNNLLTVDLSEISDLPHFELSSLAIFYGYPGLSTLTSAKEEKSVKALLLLPGYELGWAGFILDRIALTDVRSTLKHAYFSRLNAALALSDLRIHTEVWTLADAEDYLYANTPYARHRIRQMLTNVMRQPGFHVAGLAGKIKFNDIRAHCETVNRDCHSALHQQIVDQGPVPFDAFLLKVTGN